MANVEGKYQPDYERAIFDQGEMRVFQQIYKGRENYLESLYNGSKIIKKILNPTGIIDKKHSPRLGLSHYTTKENFVRAPDGQLPYPRVQALVDKIVHDRVVQAVEQAKVCDCFQCRAYASSMTKWYRSPRKIRSDQLGVMAKSLIDFSGLEPAEKADVFQVALARAIYMKIKLLQGRDPEPYQGRFPGIVNIAANSVYLDLTA